jgi:hypothetical protein
VDVLFLEADGTMSRRMEWKWSRLYADLQVKLAVNPTTGDGIVLVQHSMWTSPEGGKTYPAEFVYRRFYRDDGDFKGAYFPHSQTITWMDNEDRVVSVPGVEGSQWYRDEKGSRVEFTADSMVGMNGASEYVFVVNSRRTDAASEKTIAGSCAMIIKVFNAAGEEVKTLTIPTEDNGCNKTMQPHTSIPLRGRTFLIGECYGQKNPRNITSGTTPMRVFKVNPSGEIETWGKVRRDSMTTFKHFGGGHALRTDLAGNLYGRVGNQVFIMDVVE